MIKNRSVVTIHTDGACRGNPGPGGWGAILEAGDVRKELKGFESETTNNRMELSAVINALAALKRSSDVVVRTDSTYVIQGVTKWMINWKKNGWKSSNRKPVKNQDLWMNLDQLIQNHEINWLWVKGHSGDPGNERADALANEAIDDSLGESK